MSLRNTMGRRTFMSTGASLFATAASFILLPRVFAATLIEGRGGKAMDPMHHTTEEMDKCIKLCEDCHALCTRTIKHCLELGGRHAAAEHIRVLVDCAQLCEMSIDYMLRGSLLHEQVCGVCAEACKQCGDSCAQVAGDDQLLKQCVDLCRRCAESCERMASNVGA